MIYTEIVAYSKNDNNNNKYILFTRHDKKNWARVFVLVEKQNNINLRLLYYYYNSEEAGKSFTPVDTVMVIIELIIKLYKLIVLKNVTD